MTDSNTLKGALIEQLKDIYDAENQLAKALPKLEKVTSNRKLKSAFKKHVSETEEQIKRLEQVAHLLRGNVSGKSCSAMQEILSEIAEIFDGSRSNGAVIDSLLIGAVRRIEHYEIAAYETARSMANILSEFDVMALLEQSLKEELDADSKLAEISDAHIFRLALDGTEASGPDEIELLDVKRTISGRLPGARKHAV